MFHDRQSMAHNDSAINRRNSLDAFIRDNPDWYALEIVDGFGAHLNNYDALKMRLDAKIICVKEEGDSSSVNQAYDKFVAKNDKREHRLTLRTLRKMQGANNTYL